MSNRHFNKNKLLATTAAISMAAGSFVVGKAMGQSPEHSNRPIAGSSIEHLSPAEKRVNEQANSLSKLLNDSADFNEPVQVTVLNGRIKERVYDNPNTPDMHTIEYVHPLVLQTGVEKTPEYPIVYFGMQNRSKDGKIEIRPYGLQDAEIVYDDPEHPFISLPVRTFANEDKIDGFENPTAYAVDVHNADQRLFMIGAYEATPHLTTPNTYPPRV